MRDLNEIFETGHTTVISFGGASVAQVIKMMESQNQDQLDILIVRMGTNVIRGLLLPQRAGGNLWWSAC